MPKYRQMSLHPSSSRGIRFKIGHFGSRGFGPCRLSRVSGRSRNLNSRKERVSLCRNNRDTRGRSCWTEEETHIQNRPARLSVRSYFGPGRLSELLSWERRTKRAREAKFELGLKFAAANTKELFMCCYVHSIVIFEIAGSRICHFI